MTPESDKCLEVGYLMVGGKRVATLRCEEPAGHAAPDPDLPSFLPGTPHRAAFTWQDDAPEIADDWPERYDLDETFEVDVPMLDAETLAEIAETSRDDLRAAVERLKLVEPVAPDYDALDALDAILRARDLDRVVESLRGSGA
jgi:hypothetical protein